jgi:hypothetical protein
MRRYSLPGALLVGAVLLAVAGCGDNLGTVTGTVTLDGELITFGNVVFHGANGKVAQANIQPEGTYTATKVPLGEVVVTVQTYPLPPQVRPPDAPPEKNPTPGKARFTPIHANYADTKLTPLRYTVQPGSQEHEVKLTKSGK